MSSVRITVSSPLGDVDVTQETPSRFRASLFEDQAQIQKLLKAATARVYGAYGIEETK